MNKRALYALVMAYWIISVNFFGYTIYISPLAFLDLLPIDINDIENPTAQYWFSPFQFLESTLFAIIFGALFIAVNEFSEKIRIERFGFGRIILVKSLIYLAGFAMAGFLVYSILYLLGVYPEDAFEGIVWSNSFYTIVVLTMILLGYQIVLLNFFLQTIKKFGTNNILNFITGKYQRPVVEDRIFLFMDLKSSTAYAEKLGSIKYSHLVKDCFEEINGLVETYHAEIYQYVGDEVVLTWKSKHAIDSLDYIKVFFAFQDAVASRSEYYLSRYGIVPEFKAGLNGGSVTVAEIGNIKRDIAYHGDVVNTTSRIQEICNQFNKRLLTSGEFIRRIETSGFNGYAANFIGHLQLKGKARKIDVYSIEEFG